MLKGITKVVKSPFNYTGGKYKLLPQLIPLFPKNIDTCVDLFAGGGNIGINIDANKIILNDNLIYVMSFYHFLKDSNIDNILEKIEYVIDEFSLSKQNEIGYKLLRERYNITKSEIDFFLLSCYSFNHQIRFNNSHQFNIPFGKERSCFNASIKQNLKDFHSVIINKEIYFSTKDFREFSFDNINSDDFVYLDPPYLITNASYNDGKRGFTGWTEKEELDLLEILNKLDRKNIRFALSNVICHKDKSNDILIKWINEKKHNIHDISKSYSNCNYQTLNKKNDITREVLITNY